MFRCPSYVNMYLGQSYILGEPALFINRSNSKYDKVSIVNNSNEIAGLHNTLVFNREDYTFRFIP